MWLVGIMPMGANATPNAAIGPKLADVRPIAVETGSTWTEPGPRLIPKVGTTRAEFGHPN